MKKRTLSVMLLLIASVGNAYENAPLYGQIENCQSCEPDCCEIGTGFFSADLLYWRAFENGLNVCVPTQFTDETIPGGPVISRFKGKGRDPHFEWNPGFRIFAGFAPSCTDWDVAASWTHFNSHAHARNHESKLRWNIEFDVVDVMLGYEFDTYSCLTVRPFIGLRGARIDQHLKEHFTDLNFDDSFEGFIHNKQDFWGVGPLIGIEGEWNVWCSFSLYANAAISWLYGDFDVRLDERDTSIDSLTFCTVKNHHDASVAAVDAGIGVRWETCFCNNNRLILQIGLEHHRYFDYNRIGNYGDLSFDGVNFSVGIEF